MRREWIRTPVWVVLVCVVAGAVARTAEPPPPTPPVAPAPPNPPAELERFDYSANEILLQDVLRELGQKGDCQIFATVAEDEFKKVTVDLKKTTWREALAAVARKLDLRVESDVRWDAISFLTRDPKITKEFKATPAGEACFALAKEAGQYMVVLGEFKTPISEKFEHAPFSEALQKIAAQAKLVLQEGPNHIWLVLDEQGVKNQQAAEKVQHDYYYGIKDPPRDIDFNVKFDVEFRDQTLVNILSQGRKSKQFRIWFNQGEVSREERDKFATQRMSFLLHGVTAVGVVEYLSRRLNMYADFSETPKGAVTIYSPSSTELDLGKREMQETMRVSSPDEIDVRDAVNWVCIKEKLNCILSPDVKGKFFIRFKGLQKELALRLFLNPLGYAVVEERSGAFRINATELIGKQVMPRGTRGWIAHMAFTNADLRDVLNAFGLQMERRFVFDPQIKNFDAFKVTCRLEGVDGQVAVEEILRNFNLVLEDRGDEFFITVPKE